MQRGRSGQRNTLGRAGGATKIGVDGLLGLPVGFTEKLPSCLQLTRAK